MQAAGDILDTARRISRSGRRGRDVRELFASWLDRIAGTAAKKAHLKWWSIRVGPPLVILLAVGGYFLFRAMPQPDYRRDSIRKVFTYTLLTDEFNKLPVERRMELIGQLVQRLKGMSAGDSVLLAAFASGIAGEARKHIEENISRLAIDLWDKHALEYANVKPEDRAAFFDATAVEFIRMMESMGGDPSKKSDAEILADIHKQTERDKKELRGDHPPPSQALGRLFTFMHGNVGDHASNDQKARGQLMMRDMMRHFRGTDDGPK
jgi:hypothetical protein